MSSNYSRSEFIALAERCASYLESPIATTTSRRLGFPENSFTPNMHPAVMATMLNAMMANIIKNEMNNQNDVLQMDSNYRDKMSCNPFQNDQAIANGRARKDRAKAIPGLLNN